MTEVVTEQSGSIDVEQDRSQWLWRSMCLDATSMMNDRPSRIDQGRTEWRLRMHPDAATARPARSSAPKQGSSHLSLYGWWFVHHGHISDIWNLLGFIHTCQNHQICFV